MVEHTILLRKLEHYEIRGLALKWMTSYLKNRSQFVSLSGENSAIKHMQYGVSQGSILGPLLFIIYINYPPNIFNRAKFILYADDANIIIENLQCTLSLTSYLWFKLLGWSTKLQTKQSICHPEKVY